MADNRDRTVPSELPEVIQPMVNYPTAKEFAAFKQGAIHRALHRPFRNNPFDPKTKTNEWLRWREGWLAQMNWTTAAVNDKRDMN